ncbi:rho guanine nucleotide exchange factor 39 isoform X1 [Acipenser ruthenus]|uniref:rho guanine nucleotide exchange factor 39 isoform X1 n=1 Tax=Acipenser ruthenus TaxID=7906 RepID=UPI0027421B7C|nr:rho guanine nucleotide exchange factor 39 isoform X1 [Acipenser ruthenus]XP_058842344.1 rho guanine nucleotide exchange factor 39 isoform X1 [Acipenser ruthenus]XP_058842345.1 rho guanine nucleotide exchange factor 39 isoform X1 [Acipenser ruthenus]
MSEQLSTPTPMSVHLKQPGGRDALEEQRACWERKRRRAGRELVETEQRYNEQLELVTTYFVEILKAKGTLRQDIRVAIFSSIKSIHAVNQSLLSHLEDGKFGPGFEEFCPHLHHYTAYADNMENAVKVLQVQVSKNKAFARFKRLQESRSEFRGLTLEELLPLPLQRIHQYKHFLRDMTENTTPDRPEFQQLARAVKAVSGVSQHIQDRAHSHHNQLHMLRVQKTLKGRKTKVLAPGRWYIREGWLSVVAPKGEEVKPKMFFLFSDVLLMTKPCHPLHPTNSDKFECQSLYPLGECIVDKVFGHTRSQGGLISLTFEREKLLLMSSDQEDINDWYRSLSSATRQLKSRSAVVHKKDPLTRRPLRPTEEASCSGNGETAAASAPGAPSGRKRNLPLCLCSQGEGEEREHAAHPDSQLSLPESQAVSSKRIRLAESPQEPQPTASSCTIL